MNKKDLLLWKKMELDGLKEIEALDKERRPKDKYHLRIHNKVIRGMKRKVNRNLRLIEKRLKEL